MNSTCGPRPFLAASGETSNPNLVWFDRTDYGVISTGGFTIYIRNSNGDTRTIGKGFDLATHFSIPQSDFFPNTMNWVQIETDAACGHTGYSNAISYSYTSPVGGGHCLPSMTGGRFAFSGSGSKLKASAISTCGAGTQYNVYFLATGDDSIVTLNGSTPTTIPNKLLSSLPCGSGEGTYWVARVVDYFPVEESPRIVVNGSSCGGSVNVLGTSPPSLPGQPSMNLQYVHWDHLGSTRMMTDENGISIAAFKYYPFGMEAESSGGDEVRQRFTGHERDSGVGLDYMMARSCRMLLGRFLSPDEYDGSVARTLPQSWNRYSYVSNTPVNAIDRTGYAAEFIRALCATNGTCDAPGGPGDGDSVGGDLRDGGRSYAGGMSTADTQPTATPDGIIPIGYVVLTNCKHCDEPYNLYVEVTYQLIADGHPVNAPGYEMQEKTAGVKIEAGERSTMQPTNWQSIGPTIENGRQVVTDAKGTVQGLTVWGLLLQEIHFQWYAGSRGCRKEWERDQFWHE